MNQDHPTQGHTEDRSDIRDADTVGATSRWGKPVTIGGAIAVVVVLVWAIIASGWFL